MTEYYPIGTPGVPWGASEKQAWLDEQSVQRSHADEVVSVIERLANQLDELVAVEQYDTLATRDGNYPLITLRTRDWQANRPAVLITGGVHGYETSGVHGALGFVDRALADFASEFNFIVVPCVSPWAYETINRWNPHTVDPNRAFHAAGSSAEAASLMRYLQDSAISFTAHFDLHETTDTDNSEFRPALAARDAVHQDIWDIPDGFYLVGDSVHPAAEFQAAMIESVAKVTHIAEADDGGRLIGVPIEQHGVINYATRQLGLCAGVTDARCVTTTEVYPDSPRASSENCIEAQIAAITGGLNWLRTSSVETD